MKEQATACGRFRRMVPLSVTLLAPGPIWLAGVGPSPESWTAHLTLYFLPPARCASLLLPARGQSHLNWYT